MPGFPAEADPPEHTAIRKLLVPWFSRTAVDDMRPKIECIVGGVFDNIIAKGTFDVVTAFNSLQFANDPANAAREAARVAREGAPVVIAVWGEHQDCDAKELALPPA